MTTGTGGSAEGTDSRVPEGLAGLVEAIEDDERLDRVGDAIASVTGPLLASPRLRSALRGEWQGHALHPILTDIPIGTWTSALLLDLVGGRRARPAATALVGIGVAAAVPTVASGLAEWEDTRDRARRVGVAHALANSTGLVLFVMSLVARLTGRHRGGVTLGVLGAVALGGGGYLGGHLSIAQKVGTADPRFLRRSGGRTGDQTPVTPR